MSEKEKCCCGEEHKHEHKHDHDHDCHCGCGEHDDADFITLEFDNGDVVECEILGVFDLDDKEYIALLPTDGEDDVYIYGYKEVGDDEFELVDIEDDEEFERAVAEFDKLTVEEL